MTKQSVEPANSGALISALMDPRDNLVAQWSASDLNAILNHQLDVTLRAALDDFGQVAGESHQALLQILGDQQDATFFGVLSSPDVSREVNGLIKDYAKAAVADETILPADVARVLYVMSLMAGRRNGHADLTTLDSASVDRERLRCLTLGWLPERARDMLRA